MTRPLTAEERIQIYLSLLRDPKYKLSTDEKLETILRAELINAEKEVNSERIVGL